MNTILVATGDMHFYQQLVQSQTIASNGYQIASEAVVNLHFLQDTIDIYKPRVLVIHESLLQMGEAFDEEKLLFQTIRQIRAGKTKTPIRIFYVCSPQQKTSFYNQLLAMQILDFIDVQQFTDTALVDALSEKAELASALSFFQQAEAAAQAEAVQYRFAQPTQVIDSTPTVRALASKVIVVGSLYPGAGATLLGANLARALTETELTISYIEHPTIQPYMYDYLQLSSQPINPNEADVLELAKELVEQGQPVGAQQYGTKYGVQWQLNHPNFIPYAQYSFEELVTKMYTLQSNVIVVDVGTNWLDTEIQKFLRLADQILLCLEPDMIKNQSMRNNAAQKEILKALQAPELFRKFETVLMKQVHNIDLKAIRQHLPKMPITEIPYVDYADYVQALYKTRLVYDLPEYKNDLSAAFAPIIQRTVPFNVSKGNDVGLKNKLMLGIKGKLFNS